MSGASMTFSVDASSLQNIMGKLSIEAYTDALSRAVTDIAFEAEGQIKARTPVVTGNLRRSIRADRRASYTQKRVASNAGVAEYGWWIETGETLSGRKMVSRPGGYRMFEEGSRATAELVPGILTSIVSEIEKVWSK